MTLDHSNYQKLTVWQESYKLCVAIYSTTKKFPKEELFGLTSQMRRSSFSVPSNIAEAYGRSGKGEKKQFLSIAKGSATELETQIMLAFSLGYMEKTKEEELLTKAIEVLKMLTKLIQHETPWKPPNSKLPPPN